MLTLPAFTFCEANSWLMMMQPLNTLSNLIYLVLAIWLWNDSSARLHRYGLLLITVCSSIWHATAIAWTFWLDITGIVIWISLFVMDIASARKASIISLMPYLVGGLLGSVLTGKLLEAWLPMHSGAFIPFVVVMIGMVFHPAIASKAKPYCAISAITMTGALVTREIDLPMCTIFATGSHWLWHVLSAFAVIGPVMLLRYHRK
tara:strand:- start:372 stop:983 length:612 start_codon:yes stop_codon:yes gene_type:complete